MPLCDSFPLPLECSSSFHSITRCRIFILRATQKRGGTPQIQQRDSWRRFTEENNSVGQPIRVYAAHLLSHASRRWERRGAMLNSAPTVSTPSPVCLASRRKACPSLEMENAMCENYEVSEVWGLAEEGTDVTVLLVLWNNLVGSSYFWVDVPRFQDRLKPGME